MFTLNQSPISGCLEILNIKKQDSRGYFVKVFHDTFFKQHGLATDFKEQYFSMSVKGCLRGMHFQIPPMDHEKLVYCISGRVLDVVVDLRRSSPTYGMATSFDLSEERANAVYIPKGMAHGFYVFSPEAVLVYNVTTTYSQSHDRGLHWKSVPIEWPDQNPVISERDSSHQYLNEFMTPFE